MLITQIIYVLGRGCRRKDTTRLTAGLLAQKLNDDGLPKSTRRMRAPAANTARTTTEAVTDRQGSINLVDDDDSGSDDQYVASGDDTSDDDSDIYESESERLLTNVEVRFWAINCIFCLYIDRSLTPCHPRPCRSHLPEQRNGESQIRESQDRRRNYAP